MWPFKKALPDDVVATEAQRFPLRHPPEHPVYTQAMARGIDAFGMDATAREQLRKLADHVTDPYRWYDTSDLCGR